MTGQSQGALAQLCINGQTMEFLTLRGGAVYELVDNTGEAIRGTTDRAKERVKAGLQKVDLLISMNPSPAELDVLMILIGMDESPADTFTVDDGSTTVMDSFAVVVDRVAKVHTYATCYVNRAVFRGQKGTKPVQLDLHIIGYAETEGAAASFTCAGALDTDLAYAFTDGTLTVQSAARPIDRFALSIDNKLQRQFNNSQTATSICPTDKEITLAASASYVAANTDLHTLWMTDAAGATGTLVIADGAQTTTFTFGNLKAISSSPDIPGKTEIRKDMYYRAYSSSTTKSLVVTHTS